MDFVEIQFLEAESTLKNALKNLGFSGQKIKKFFSAKALNAPVTKQQIIQIPIDLSNHLEINPNYTGPTCHILFENDDYLAVHKPMGIHSHPLLYTDTDTVLNYLVGLGIWSVLNLNTENYDRGLLHRLDYETSGVLLLTKKEELQKSFRHDFNTQMKKKVYLAIVEGDFNLEGLHTHYFRGSLEKGSKQVEATAVDAQRAEAEFYKLQTLKNNRSLVMVILKTGIRHQIRVQLSALGFPILGDTLYGGSVSDRLYLHSWIYEWKHVVEDRNAELFSNFLDLDSALQVASDKLLVLKSS